MEGNITINFNIHPVERNTTVNIHPEKEMQRSAYTLWKERSRFIFLASRFHLLNVAEFKMLAALEAAVASFTAKKTVTRSTSLCIAGRKKKSGYIANIIWQHWLYCHVYSIKFMLSIWHFSWSKQARYSQPI